MWLERHYDLGGIRTEGYQAGAVGEQERLEPGGKGNALEAPRRRLPIYIVVELLVSHFETGK